VLSRVLVILRLARRACLSWERGERTRMRQRWRCWRALAAAALVTAAVGTASLAAAAFVTAEAPLEPPSQGVGGPRPGDAKRLLGSSQDEHAAAVHCYGTHSGSVA